MPEHDNLGRGLDAERPQAGFDLLIRSSLDTYADPGPDSQLAQRVLARIAAESVRVRTRRTIRWAIALPVAACLIVALVLLASKPPHKPADNSGRARVTLPKSTETGRIGPTENAHAVTARRNDVPPVVRRSSHAAVAVTTARLPKLDVFPTPQPLTPAEREFVAYIAHASLAERRSLVETRQQMDAPLRIEALEIKPLEPPQPGRN